MDKDIQILENFIEDFYKSYPPGSQVINIEIEAIKHLINKCRSQEKQIKLMQSINITDKFQKLIDKKKKETIEKDLDWDAMYVLDELEKELLELEIGG